MDDTRLHDDLVAMLRDMRQAERDVFGSLDPAVRDAPLRPGDWSAKDHQAHLTAWKARQARRYALFRAGQELPPVEGDETDALNAELQAARADWTWDGIVDEADQVGEQLIAEILATDPALIAGSERLLGGTFGNGAFHAMTHFGWLVEAGIGVDPGRVRRYLDEVSGLVRGGSLPEREVGTALYNIACVHAMAGELEAARSLLPEAFGLRPDLVDFARTDSDLTRLHAELDDLAAG
ncbi:MAG: TPR end-of-group domain-containing protein [Candidatus Limnocylindria bacterium]